MASKQKRMVGRFSKRCTVVITLSTENRKMFPSCDPGRTPFVCIQTHKAKNSCLAKESIGLNRFRLDINTDYFLVLGDLKKP